MTLDIRRFAAPDGATLRYGAQNAGPSPRLHVVVLPGRREYIEKYQEIADDLTARGCSAGVVEWRAHGLSDGRRADDRQKHHLDDFARPVDDLEAVLDAVDAAAAGSPPGAGPPRKPPPRVLLAHSMGGLIAALHLARRPDRYAGAILCAPMFDVAVRPWPRAAARIVAAAACVLGFGERYAFSQGKYDPAEAVFHPDNPLTGDPDRYAVLQRDWAARPEMRLGGVTFGWLRAAFRAMDDLRAGRPALDRATLPVLILSPTADRVVDPCAHAATARRFPNARVVDIDGAAHELLMERDVFRRQAWRVVDDFLARLG